jgi:hypothetical protein
VRVHAAHDCEHDCYNSFTLCRCCTRSTWVTIILGSRIPVVWTEYPYTLLRCVLGNHYKSFQWFHLACNVPTEVSPLVWASHPTRSPLLCLMGSSHHSFTHINPWFSYCNFTKYPNGLPSSFPAYPVGTPRLYSTTYYTRPYPYRLMAVLFLRVVATWTGP